MIQVDDLLYSFDQIASAQIGNRKETLLVFVDEINAKIGGQSVYETFLTPLEDGYYVRGGAKRFIHPCIWLFVGTASADEIRRDTKGSDFTSRLSLEPVSINDVPEGELNYLYVENMYVGLSIARKLYPRLKKVHRNVVALLGALGKPFTDTGVSPARISIGMSNRVIGRTVARDLYVDGLGRGNWRSYEEMKGRRELNVNIDRLSDNERWLSAKLLVEQWVRVYDSHPEFAAL